jgi:hypothetical protein
MFYNPLRLHFTFHRLSEQLPAPSPRWNPETGRLNLTGYAWTIRCQGSETAKVLDRHGFSMIPTECLSSRRTKALFHENG